MARRLISSNEAKPARVQHRSPCSDCPWARTALPGWLGDQDATQWLKDAHGEVRIDCHTKLGAQCAGAAIYRANVCKMPRDLDLMRLPADKETVFDGPGEFVRHHESGIGAIDSVDKHPVLKTR